MLSENMSYQWRKKNRNPQSRIFLENNLLIFYRLYKTSLFFVLVFWLFLFFLCTRCPDTYEVHSYPSTVIKEKDFGMRQTSCNTSRCLVVPFTDKRASQRAHLHMVGMLRFALLKNSFSKFDIRSRRHFMRASFRVFILK